MAFQPNHEYLHDGQVIELNSKRYRIIGRMIQPMGRYSEVYEAISLRSAKKCAVKMMIHEGSLLGPYYNHNLDERKRAFEVEIKLLTQLERYRNIVKIMDFGMASELELPTIIEEFCETKKRLSEYKRVFSEKEAYCFSVQLFSMLSVAHAKRIAYKDFQQPHFFFYWDEKACDGILKVVDWNLSSEGVARDLELSNEIDSMKRNGLQNFYPSNSSVFKIIFRDKHNSAMEVLVDLLRYGVKENLPCPSAIPLKHRMYFWWLKFRK